MVLHLARERPTSKYQLIWSTNGGARDWGRQPLEVLEGSLNLNLQ